jgi:hypothetical protein
MTQTQTPNKFGVKPGDIFYCSWGYDQTNIDWYEVVRVTATKAEVRPIGSRTVDSESHTNRVVPNTDHTREYDVLIQVERDDVVKTKLCTVKNGYKGGATIVLRSGHYWAYQWDGTPKYETDAWSGH